MILNFKMKLSDLNPKFLKIESDKVYRMVDEMEGADGLGFLCPVCYTRNNGEIGTHIVICWNPTVPVARYPSPGRWRIQGSGVGDLTLIGEPTSSVRLEGGCNAHFSVINGEIIPAT